MSLGITGIPKEKFMRRSVGELQAGAFGYIRRQKWTDAIATSATRLKTAQATSDSVTTTVTSFTAQPDFARQIIITPGGTTADVPAGAVALTGTDIRGTVITDTITFAANATAAVASAKAFKTVTSVVFPIQDGAGATYDIGVNDALGLDRCMTGNEVILATIDGAYETTRPTVTYSSTVVSLNTIDSNTALNAARDLVAVFVATERTTSGATTA